MITKQHKPKKESKRKVVQLGTALYGNIPAPAALDLQIKGGDKIEEAFAYFPRRGTLVLPEGRYLVTKFKD